MVTEILEAFGQLTREKAIDKSEVVELVKAGMLAAVRRKYGAEAEADILVDPASGEIDIYLLKEVVEEVEDPSRQMTVAEAKELPYVNEPWGDGDPEIGQIAEIPLDFRTFGRNAIQAAKQMIIQKVREEERNRIREEYEERVGDLVSGTVQQVDRGNALVFLDRRTEALLPGREQVRREYLRQGETVRALLLDIKETNKGPQLILSRTHPDFVRALFALEVPEVFQGIVEIRAIAREPGSRSKIAVWSRDQHVDPVGACVGLKGSRVQAVVSELGGERIDIVPWTDDPRQFIAQALSPAEVYKIILPESEGSEESRLFGETYTQSPMKSQTRFRGPTAAPAPFQPASPEETAAALEASKATLAEMASETDAGKEVEEEPGTEETKEREAQEVTAGAGDEAVEVAEEAVEKESEAGADEEENASEERTPAIAAVLDEKHATVVCAEDQLSLAIGRSGQNVRLASKLTGFRIDLVSKSEYLAKEEEILFGRKAVPAEVPVGAGDAEDFPLSAVPGVGEKTAEALAEHGYETFDDIINLEREDLLAIPGVGEKTAELLIEVIDELTEEVEEEWDEESATYVEADASTEITEATAESAVNEEDETEEPEAEAEPEEAPGEEVEVDDGRSEPGG